MTEHKNAQNEKKVCISLLTRGEAVEGAKSKIRVILFAKQNPTFCSVSASTKQVFMSLCFKDGGISGFKCGL